MRNLCGHCRKRPKQKHFNSKWCSPCSKELRTRPVGRLTPTQKAFAIRHAGDMKIDDIAKRLKTSRSDVKRSCRGTKFFFFNGKYKERPELVKQVLEYYYEHGFTATQEAFPKISVRSITDRPGYYGFSRRFRQSRWTEAEYREAVKMAGLVPYVAQANHFKRPRANAGSVKALWSKRIRSPASQLHGFADWYAKRIVTSDCPKLRVKRLTEVKPGSKFEHRSIVLWVDAEKHLRPGTPEFIREAVKTMARFSRWIFGTKNVRREIERMIQERK